MNGFFMLAGGYGTFQSRVASFSFGILLVLF
jgi:hypothetical protein